jgi:hypothetical protein
MKLRKYRYQNADVGATGGGSATLMTDGAQTTPAATSSAPVTAAGTPPVVAADATQQPATATDKTAADEAAAAALTPEAKAAAEKAATDAAAEKAAPEKYEFTAPEGVTLDPELLGEFEAFAKEQKLSQVDAQKVADMGVKMAQKFSAQQVDAVEKAAAEWTASSTADKEFGGEKLDENLAISKKALDAFGTPELRALLNDSRLGNHPEVIRFMYRAGKAISEDRMVTGGAGPATAATSTAKALYPNQS